MCIDRHVGGLTLGSFFSFESPCSAVFVLLAPAPAARGLAEFASFSFVTPVFSSLSVFSLVGLLLSTFACFAALSVVLVEAGEEVGVVVVALGVVSTPAPVTVGLLRGLDDELSSTTVSLFTVEDEVETDIATPLLGAPFTTLLDARVNIHCITLMPLTHAHWNQRIRL